MLMPKKVKHRKTQRGRLSGQAPQDDAVEQLGHVRCDRRRSVDGPEEDLLHDVCVAPPPEQGSSGQHFPKQNRDRIDIGRSVHRGAAESRSR